MVLLRYKHLTFCQFFLSRDTRKLTDIWALTYSSFSDMLDVADGHAHAQHLLQLEFDRCLQLIDLHMGTPSSAHCHDV